MEKILVIDDDKLVRKVFKLTLSKEGYDVLEAEDGRQGLQLIKTENPDLVLTDFLMPGINGLEVIAEITRLKLNIPVIMLTGYG
ncbi:MAG: response regulator, partial [Paludibacter sp.]|nr:response regulator [Paludibacter sp.]